MKNKVVWVFGCSASGKETFIESLISKKIPQIIAELGWEEKQIIKINESINYIQQYENDPIGNKRIEILDKVIVKNKNNSNTVILIKGQNIDLDNNLVELLKAKLPNVEYEIIYLFSDLNTIWKRAKRKKWFIEEDNNFADWHNHLAETTEKVKSIKGIKITAIDSTLDYKISPFPRYDKNLN